MCGEPPDFSVVVVGEPDGAETRSDTVAAGAYPLAGDCGGGGVDPGDRLVGHGGPDRAEAEGYFATMAGKLGGDVSDSLVCFCAYASDGAIALIEGPDGVGSEGKEAWFFADGNLQDGFVGGWINFGKDVVFGGCDPDEVFGKEGTE